MVSFLLWNINRKEIQELIAKIAIEYSVDILILIESNIDSVVLLQSLNAIETRYFYASGGSLCPKIQIFTRFRSDFIAPILETDRLTIRRLNLPATPEILLAVVHFISKAFYKENDQMWEAQKYARYISNEENKAGHSRTILIGDLNMNPFECGVIGAAGFHAIMSRKIVRGYKRKVQGENYPFFYNPMWNLLGDLHEGPPGTYYFDDSGKHIVYYWNMFDQVLIRPDLLESFINNELRIIDSINGFSLLNKRGIPDKKIASDHLPVFFKLAL